MKINLEFLCTFFQTLNQSSLTFFFIKFILDITINFHIFARLTCEC